ncbi:helix-turn-helix domain-containing protein [Actinophytocola sp. KF-1]
MARDRVIGARLRAIRRQQAGISLEDAAMLAGWSASTLSRTECGHRHVSVEEVAILLTAWSVPAGLRTEVLAEFRAGCPSGWRDRPIPGIPVDAGGLASYENDAHALVSVATMGVPTLLQTRETAIGVMRAAGWVGHDCDMNWVARQKRQRRLGNVDYHAYISQTAIHTPFGGPRAWREQLEHLYTAGDRGIGVRVIPEHQSRITLPASWTTMYFPTTAPVVHIELAAGGIYFHGSETTPYTQLLHRLEQIALSQDRTRALLAHLLQSTPQQSGSTPVTPRWPNNQPSPA